MRCGMHYAVRLKVLSVDDSAAAEHDVEATEDVLRDVQRAGGL